jgi:hypothetical protein
VTSSVVVASWLDSPRYPFSFEPRRAELVAAGAPNESDHTPVDTYRAKIHDDSSRFSNASRHLMAVCTVVRHRMKPRPSTMNTLTRLSMIAVAIASLAL